MEILFIVALMSVGVGALANVWGRSFWAFFALSLFLSPVIGLITILCVGKTLEAKAAEARMLKVLEAENGAD